MTAAIMFAPWLESAGARHPNHGRLPKREATACLPCFIVMDSGRRIIQASPFAFRLVEECPSLTLVCGTLCATATEDGSRLFEAFQSVLAGRQLQALVRLRSCGLLTDIQLALLSGDGTSRVIAIISQPEARIEDQVERAIRAFELTASEARLLRLLCAGHSLSQASALLDVERNTVRTHLQRIFQKTGTHRQAELIRRVLAP